MRLLLDEFVALLSTFEALLVTTCSPLDDRVGAEDELVVCAELEVGRYHLCRPSIKVANIVSASCEAFLWRSLGGFFNGQIVRVGFNVPYMLRMDHIRFLIF